VFLIILCISTILNFSKKNLIFLFSAKLCDMHFLDFPTDTEMRIYMTFLKFWEWLDFPLQTPQVPCLLLSILFHSPDQQKHLSTGLVLSQVEYINMLIWKHALKLTPKYVTILFPLDFKRLAVQVFSERQVFHLIKKIFIYISMIFQIR